MKRVILSRIILNERSPEQTVFLKEEGEPGRVMPIVIGIFEANAIQMGLYKISPARPMTHDLLSNTIKSFGAALQHVFIYKLEQSTFFAMMYFKTDKGVVKVDGRPSDAIALSVRLNAPIYVDDTVFDSVAVEETPLDYDIT